MLLPHETPARIALEEATRPADKSNWQATRPMGKSSSELEITRLLTKRQIEDPAIFVQRLEDLANDRHD